MIKYQINIHSFSDIITNSSTELFSCDTDHSLEQVKSLILTLCKINNDMEWFNNDCNIRLDENNKIEIYSFLNMSDIIRNFIINELNGKDIW